MTGRAPWRPLALPPVRFAALWPPEPGWGLFGALAAFSALPLAIAAATWLARPPAPAAPVKLTYDRLPVQTVSFWAPPAWSAPLRGEAEAELVPLPPERPPVGGRAQSHRVRTQGLCARHGLRQVWYGPRWRCR